VARANQYAGECTGCGVQVPAGRGILTGRRRAWQVWCAGCAEEAVPAGAEEGSGSGGGRAEQRGRCEDAPCCGCCDTGSGSGYVGYAALRGW
jgi:hypothetical protein